MAKRRVLREIRTCAAPRCGITFECKVTSRRKYCCSGHSGKGIHPSDECIERSREVQAGTWKDPVIRAKRIAGMKKPKPVGFGEKESAARMGEDNPNYGKRRSKNWKTQQSIRIKKLYQKGVRMGGLTPSTKPSGLENKLISFFKKYDLDFRYCGNGTSIIGGKCPDFFHIFFKNKLIEVGNIVFYRVFRPDMTKHQYVQERTKHFEKYGFQTLVIWEEELSNELKLLGKIETFLGA